MFTNPSLKEVKSLPDVAVPEMVSAIEESKALGKSKVAIISTDVSVPSVTVELVAELDIVATANSSS